MGNQEAATGDVFIKKVFLNISQNSQENTCLGDSFSKKSRPQTCNFAKKESLLHVFSGEFCENFKSTFFTEDL